LQAAWPGIESTVKPVEFEITEDVDGDLDDNVGECSLDDHL
jgi:hypothetical protein